MIPVDAKHGRSRSRRTTSLAACLTGALLLLPGCAHVPEVSQDWDTLIINARIVDGTGSPWYRGSVAVSGETIAWVGTGEPDSDRAERVIDAADKVLSPGFVDMMGQGSMPYLTDPASAGSKLMQGITLHASGEGWTPAPQTPETQPEPQIIDGVPYRWSTYEDYFCLLESYGVPVNLVHNVGATQARLVVIGEENRPPSASELARMQQLVAEAMEAGATGLSSALIYPPSTYQTTEELTALAEAIRPYGGVYTTHLRNESSKLLEAIDEALEIGRQAGVPVHIYHLKAAGEGNWPLIDEALAKLEQARAEGMDVTADIYPYLRNGLGLGAFLPPDAYAQGRASLREALADPEVRASLKARIEEDGDWENWFHHIGRDWNNVQIIDSSLGPDVVGLSIQEAADLRGVDAWQFLFDTLAEVEIAVAPLSMNPEQKAAILQKPFIMFDTDISPVSPERNGSATHPRAYGSMARVLALYVREEGLLTLEDAVRRMTSASTNRLGMFDRGRIAAGQAADMVLFDPDTIQDHATYEHPAQYPTGIDYVWVNGTLAVEHGELTDARAGRVLRHGAATGQCH